MGKLDIICTYIGCSSHTNKEGKTTILYKFLDHYGYQFIMPVYGHVTACPGDRVKCTLTLKREYNFTTLNNNYFYYFENVTVI